jgi:hypothetical protein
VVAVTPSEQEMIKFRDDFPGWLEDHGVSSQEGQVPYSPADITASVELDALRTGIMTLIRATGGDNALDELEHAGDVQPHWITGREDLV